MGRKQIRIRRYVFFFVAGMIITATLLAGCGPLHQGFLATSTFKEANDFFSQGSYKAALGKYEQIMKEYPEAADRALFEMGIIYAYPGNWQKDYQKSLECFQRLVRDYPKSEHKPAGEVMIAHLNNITNKEQKIVALQTQIETLGKEVKGRENEIVSRQQKIEALEQEITKTAIAIRNIPADKILIEKKERRLTLLSGCQVLRTYKIALGGNPTGPKERQGDNKTPEGTYVIDSRNKDSRYHLSLHISYPDEKDKKRARKLGVDPGGDIMIHGIKHGLGWVGGLHTESDWTKGCIAVTDEEIEEIDRLTPIGTPVEIRP